MHQRTEQPDTNANPPHQCVAAINVKHSPAQPDSDKAAKLVREENDAVKRAHIAQSENIRDKSACKRHGGQPKHAHKSGKDEHADRRNGKVYKAKRYQCAGQINSCQ